MQKNMFWDWHCSCSGFQAMEEEEQVKQSQQWAQAHPPKSQRVQQIAT